MNLKLLVSCLIVSCSASAVDFDNQYVKFSVGNTYTIDFENEDALENKVFKNINSNFFTNLEFSYGIKFNKNIRSEISFSKGKIRDNVLKYKEITLDSAKTKYSDLSAAVYYDFADFNKHVVPYVGFGAGVSRVSYEEFINPEFNDIDDINHNTRIQYLPIYKLSAGLNVNLNEKFSVDMAYKYNGYLGVMDIDKSDRGNRSIRPNNHNILVGLRYNF